jgi:hypothetical protein
MKYVDLVAWCYPSNVFKSGSFLFRMVPPQPSFPFLPRKINPKTPGISTKGWASKRASRPGDQPWGHMACNVAEPAPFGHFCDENRWNLNEHDEHVRSHDILLKAGLDIHWVLPARVRIPSVSMHEHVHVKGESVRTCRARARDAFGTRSKCLILSPVQRCLETFMKQKWLTTSKRAKQRNVSSMTA